MICNAMKLALVASALFALSACGRKETPAPPAAPVENAADAAPAATAAPPVVASGSAPAAASATPEPAARCSILDCNDACPCAGHDTCVEKRCVRDPKWKIAEIVAGGDAFACASYADGHVWCAGNNVTGQLGRGTDLANDPTLSKNELRGPGRVDAVRAPTQLAAGESHACALWPAGVSCWGLGGNGELGWGIFRGDPSPQMVRDLPDATSIVARGHHTCAIKKSGAVVCWGANRMGQLGDGTTEGRAAPVAVVGITAAKQLALGTQRSCALLRDGSVSCWGGSAEGSPPHVVAGLPHVDEIAATAVATCARSGGTVRCWGPDFGDRPAVVKSITEAAHIAAGRDIVCALRTNGEVFCTSGQGEQAYYVTNDSEKKHLQARLMVVSEGYACSVRKDERLDCDVDLRPALKAVIEQL